jgi:hypothetical protein
MTPSSIRTMAAAAALPAALVVLIHLAVVWNGADGFAERRHIAFAHGIALAAVLGLALAAGRFALKLERGRGTPVADAIAIAGSLVVLGHLAWVWRDGLVPDKEIAVTLGHLLALAGVVAAAMIVRAMENDEPFHAPPTNETTI